MEWFYLALLAPLLFSIIILFDDNLLRLVYKNPYLATAFTGSFCMLPLVAILFKPIEISAQFAILALVAGFLNVTYYFFYFRGLQVESPSIVTALFSLSPASIPILAHFFVHEQLTGLEITGFVIVLLATLSLAITDVKKFTISKALLPVVAAVVCMDIASILVKDVYQHSDFYSTYMYFCIGSGLAGVSFFLMKFSENRKILLDIRKVLNKVLPILIFVELINLAAEFVLNLAISRGPVSLVKVIEATAPLLVLLIALLLYPFAPRFFREAKEGRLVSKLSLMAIAVAGLAFINFAAKS